jgi:hypothetical protein
MKEGLEKATIEEEHVFRIPFSIFQLLNPLLFVWIIKVPKLTTTRCPLL